MVGLTIKTSRFDGKQPMNDVRLAIANAVNDEGDWQPMLSAAYQSVHGLIEAAERVTAAFRSLGTAHGVITIAKATAECEAAMLALDAAIAKATGASDAASE